MSPDSYTYTTISAGPGEPTYVGVSFYLDEQADVHVLGAGSDRPFLAVRHGDVSVNIAPRRGGRTAADAAIARKVAEQAALYAAEVERLCSKRETGSAAA